jgi:trimethylamine--corrinoid protein Co-methyltransferase
MDEVKRPVIEFLSRDLKIKIVSEARDVLEQVGVIVENPAAVDLLASSGAKVADDGKRVKIPGALVEKCCESVPPSITLYDGEGGAAMTLGGYAIHFDPGSAALHVIDRQTGRMRKPLTADYIDFSRLADRLPHLDAHSTALICDDVPESISDSYRLYIALQYTKKPIVTGAFTVAGFSVMRALLEAAAGGGGALREKPRAIFDCCPSSPLKWSLETSQNLMDCAVHGIPAELIAMPLTGAVAPVTLSGTVVQHAAENLSGVVMHQLASPGAPLIYGGSPAAFDMRKGTTPMGAVETMMIDAAYNEIGKFLGFPTHAYMGLSDAKGPGAQAGLESAMGATIAALSGVNMISGPGMLDFESCQSFEKLVIDNEICGMAKRLVKGIAARDDVMALELLRDIHEKQQLFSSPHTLKWLREEHYIPSDVIDRSPSGGAGAGPFPRTGEAAAREVDRLLDGDRDPLIDDTARKSLAGIMKREASKAGLETLPA